VQTWSTLKDIFSTMHLANKYAMHLYCQAGCSELLTLP
jgi:hypothetical protein